jgi:syringomycin synthetase protein SyrE
VEVNVSLLKALKKISRAEGATLFMLLLAAFKVLLAQYNSQEDIVVGTAIADRRQVETETLIGFFINTLVLRTSLAGNPRFTDLLQRVKSVALEAHRHQDLPFPKLVEHLGASHALNSNPLIQVMFVLENTPLATLSLPGFQVASVPMDIGTCICDLLLSFTEVGDKLTGFIEYSTDLFDRSTIQRMIDFYLTLLETLVADPERDIESLKEHLPEYMVPATTVERKIDRKRLTKPVFAAREKEYTAPRNSTEETLCKLWADVLKLQRIGIHDNFFDFGGHSLLATQMMSRIAHGFEVELPVRVLFESPTVAELAVRLDQHRTGATATASTIPVTKDATIEQILASLDTLSEDEVELLLNLQEPI